MPATPLTKHKRILPAILILLRCQRIMIHPPLRIRPFPLWVWRLRIVDGCRGGLECNICPGSVIEGAEGFGGEEWNAAEKTAALIFVEDIYYFFAVGMLRFMF